MQLANKASYPVATRQPIHSTGAMGVFTASLSPIEAATEPAEVNGQQRHTMMMRRWPSSAACVRNTASHRVWCWAGTAGDRSRKRALTHPWRALTWIDMKGRIWLAGRRQGCDDRCGRGVEFVQG